MRRGKYRYGLIPPLAGSISSMVLYRAASRFAVFNVSRTLPRFISGTAANLTKGRMLGGVSPSIPYYCCAAWPFYPNRRLATRWIRSELGNAYHQPQRKHNASERPRRPAVFRRSLPPFPPIPSSMSTAYPQGCYIQRQSYYAIIKLIRPATFQSLVPKTWSCGASNIRRSG